MIKLKDIKLKQKITYAIIAILIIPTIVLELVGYFYINNQYKEDVYNNALAVSNQYKDQIKGKLNSINNYMTNLANNTYLNNFLGWNYSNDYLSLSLYRDIEKYIVALSTVNTHLYDQLEIYFMNESIPEKLPIFINYQRLDPIYQSDDDLSLGFFNMFMVDNQVTFIKPMVSNIDQSILGIMKLSISKTKLFGPLDLYDNEQISMLIVDKENNLIFAPFSQTSKATGSNTIKKLFMGDNLIIEDAVDDYDLKIITSIPNQHILSGTRNAARSVGIYLIIGMLILIGAIYFIIDLFLHRLKFLSEAMIKFSKGDFDIVLDNHSEDEIGQIIQTFNGMTRDINSLNASLLEKERMRQEADVKALRAQINPHFIYNTIEIFRSRADLHDDYILSSGLYAMGKMLRYSTNWIENSTLEKELDHITEYIKLTSVLREEISLSINGDQSLLSCEVPKMLLQPIIENSIEHGTRQNYNLNIDVSYMRKNDKVIIEIYDDGVGIEQEKLRQLNDNLRKSVDGDVYNKSIALKNINNRIIIRYGQEYGLYIDSTERICTQVKIVLPYLK